MTGRDFLCVNDSSEMELTVERWKDIASSASKQCRYLCRILIDPNIYDYRFAGAKCSNAFSHNHRSKCHTFWATFAALYAASARPPPQMLMASQKPAVSIYWNHFNVKLWQFIFLLKCAITLHYCVSLS